MTERDPFFSFDILVRETAKKNISLYLGNLEWELQQARWNDNTFRDGFSSYNLRNALMNYEKAKKTYGI